MDATRLTQLVDQLLQERRVQPRPAKFQFGLRSLADTPDESGEPFEDDPVRREIRAIGKTIVESAALEEMLSLARSVSDRSADPDFALSVLSKVWDGITARSGGTWYA